MIILDCGDNSCFFAPKKGGMRTNGGCRCFENAGYGRSATKAAYDLLPKVLELEKKLKELQTETRECLNCGSTDTASIEDAAQIADNYTNRVFSDHGTTQEIARAIRRLNEKKSEK